jgi:hypothetical protein
VDIGTESGRSSQVITGSSLLGGFSRAFDLISSSYGWSDDAIMDLTVGRTRQILAAISERMRNQDIVKRLYIEWQTKTLGFLMAGLAWDAKQATKIHKAVERIKFADVPGGQRTAEKESPRRLVEGEKAPDDLPSAEGIFAMFGGGRGIQGPRPDDPGNAFGY